MRRRPACAAIPHTDTGADVIYAGLVMQPSLHSDSEAIRKEGGEAKEKLW